MTRAATTRRLWKLILLPAALGAQARGDTASAPIRDVRYEITFTRASAAKREVSVEMAFTTTGSAPVVLSLPAWTPGAYELDNFARYIVDFEASSADGKPLTWDKLDYDTWRIRPAGAKSVRASFLYRADTLDNAMAWAKPDFLLFNGTNLFLYPEGQPLDFPANVFIQTESDWKITTGMTASGSRHYSAASYHDLVDMPFFIGRYDVDSMRIAGKVIRYATYPTGVVSGQARNNAWEQLRKVIPAEIAVFGEVPWENYTVMQIVDSAFGGASGLEHQSSHVDVLAPSYVGSEFQPSLYAHEIFHSWNVKRIRPAEMWPYQYSHPQPTPWLWVSEGITDYYADLAETRGGVVDADGFYALTAEKINEVMNAPPVSLEDASVDTWIHPVDGTGYLYYPKGSLAGLLIDIMIRDASDNRHSLDDVMRGLYQNVYKRGRGFTSSDWWNSVSAAANGKSFTGFAARYIDGREAFPWDTVLPLAGLRARQESVPRLGVLTQMDANGVLVANVGEGSAAAVAGVRGGDYLISVGDIPVEDQQFGARMRAKYGASVPGTPMPIKVRRAGEELTLAGKLQFGPGDLVVEEDPAASPKAVRIRQGILRGVTDK
ncbi:MAG TPA: PDZ domain-containing protein [Gemmatimonadaceae bacterium]|nr:PDZ domain-containing protein [Gemmatimonadaceae bacterium]